MITFPLLQSREYVVATNRLPEGVEAGSICRGINFTLEFGYIKNIRKRTQIGAFKTGQKVFLVK